jgi:hypothetical protein
MLLVEMVGLGDLLDSLQQRQARAVAEEGPPAKEPETPLNFPSQEPMADQVSLLFHTQYHKQKVLKAPLFPDKLPHHQQLEEKYTT